MDAPPKFEPAFWQRSFVDSKTRYWDVHWKVI
jgi:hypothetical protein